MGKTTHEKNCLSCRGGYTAYRSDSKYCSDECRSHAFYRKTEESRADAKKRVRITKNTNDILWSNRQLLIQYDKMEITLEELIKKGFKAEYITRRRKTQGKIVYEIYDITAIELDVGRFRIGKYLDT